MSAVTSALSAARRGPGTKNTGRLTEVNGLLPGETVDYTYTPRGQVATAIAMNQPAQDGPSPRRINERWSYDRDGVVRTDTVVAGTGTTATLRAESFVVDAGGRILSDSDGTTWRSIMPTQMTYSYSGLGQVLGSYAHSTSPDGGSDLNAHETMTYDAMGNWVTRTNAAALKFGESGVSSFQYSSAGSDARYAAGTGRLRGQTFAAGGVDTLEYDAAGNQHAMLTTNAGDTAQYNERVSYYSVDGQLAAADARAVAGTALRGHLAFEEYRYDALGRRVLTRVRRWCDDIVGTADDGAFCDVSAIRRTVWNGSSELAEIQMPAADTTPADTVENDTLAIARERQAFPTVPLYDANRLYGRVLYVDGLATDQPVFITRVNYADASDDAGVTQPYAVYAPFSIYPLWNAQGRADRAVLGGGAEPGVTADSLCAGARCAEVAFDRGLFPYARSGSDDGSWQGTLLVDKPNATGTYYRRNRNYDPNTARFTQPDPIGLAGGLNAYGFASGDPVNFSDPMGLAPVSTDTGAVASDSVVTDSSSRKPQAPHASFTPKSRAQCSIYFESGSVTGAMLGDICGKVPDGPRANTMRGCLQALYTPKVGYARVPTPVSLPPNPIDLDIIPGVGAHVLCGSIAFGSH